MEEVVGYISAVFYEGSPPQVKEKIKRNNTFGYIPCVTIYLVKYKIRNPNKGKYKVLEDGTLVIKISPTLSDLIMSTCPYAKNFNMRRVLVGKPERWWWGKIATLEL